MTTDHRLGTSVGDYLIEDILGRGGMGVVYRARHRTDGRVVALKLMLPELAANEDFRDRFIREAEFGPTLDHPNIVPVYETGEVEGELFIAMHLVEGCDLKTLIKREGRLAPRRAMPILEQAATALDAAHEMVVVHRDVKPQNMMIAPGDGPDEPDHVFLTDFGLIRPASSESTASRTGQIFGSLQYMAPEQIEGLPADGRADVYSLACVAFECFTGQIPFERPNEIGAIWAHIHEEPPRVSDVRPDLPGGIDDVIRQGMAKHPDDRYLTCGELVSDLEAGLKKRGRQLVPTPLRPLVKRVTRPKTEREIWAPNFFPELSRVRKLTNRTNWAQVAAIMAALLLLPSALLQFVHPQGVVGAVADAGEGVVAAVQRAGEAVGDTFGAEDDGRPLAEPPTSSAVARAKSRRQTQTTEVGAALLAEARRDAVQDSGEDPPTETIPKDGAMPGIAEQPVANGKLFFEVADWPANDQSDLHAVEPDGSGLTRITRLPGWTYAPSWTRDGRSMAFVNEPSAYKSVDLWVYDNRTGRIVEISDTPRLSEFSPSWSPDGTKIMFAGLRDYSTSDYQGTPYFSGLRTTSLWVVDRDGSDRRRIASSERGFFSPSWSPDGRRVVFARLTSDGSTDLFVMRVDGSRLRNITRTPRINEGSASWSPDGRRLVFMRGNCSNRDLWPYYWGNFCGDVWTTTPSDSNEVRVVGTPDAEEYAPIFSPDGTRIAFVGDSAGDTSDIFTVAVDGSDRRRVTLTPERVVSMPGWQPVPTGG